MCYQYQSLRQQEWRWNPFGSCMRMVAALNLCFVFSLAGISSATQDHHHSCGVDSLDPPVCSMENLDPPNEKPPGESALLQQVTVQMRKPFEPEDNLPQTSTLLELVEERSPANRGHPFTSQKKMPISSLGPLSSANQVAAHSSVEPAQVSATPLVANQSALSSSAEPAKSSDAPPASNEDSAHSLLETIKHEIKVNAKGAKLNKTNTTDSLSLQVLAAQKEDDREPEAVGSRVSESGGEPGLQTSARSSSRWLEMLHVGKNIQRGKGFISFETILLFCALSLVVGVLIWGVVCLWNYSSGSLDHHHEEIDKAPKVSSTRPSIDRPAYAQRGPPQASSGGNHHEPTPGSSRLSAYPPVNPSPRPQPRKEAFREPPAAQPEMASGPMAPMRALCPELIVPRGSECILVVRYLPPGQKDQVEFDILDINGEPVLKVEVVPSSGSARQNAKQIVSQRSRSPTIILKSLQPRETTGGFVFAYCRITTKDDDSGGKQQNVYIYKEDDELYAHLMKDEMRKRYVLTSGHHGLQLLFEGNFEEHVVNVTNESGDRVAATEPRVMHFDPTKFYKLRVAANADVGLVLCGLLMISQMEFRS